MQRGEQLSKATVLAVEPRLQFLDLLGPYQGSSQDARNRPEALPTYDDLVLYCVNWV